MGFDKNTYTFAKVIYEKHHTAFNIKQFQGFWHDVMDTNIQVTLIFKYSFGQMQENLN